MRFITLLGLSLCGLASAVSAQEASFDQTVAPVLMERCIDCHGGSKPKGGLDLTRKETAFKGGKSGPGVVAKRLDQSELWQRVEAGEMPPKKPLPAMEKAILKAWIESGAAWGTDPIDPFRVTTGKRAGNDWWSLQPIKRPALPKIRQNDWPRKPIDHFILAKLEAERLTPSPQADPRTLIRRLYFDLIGLPPNYEETAAFVKQWNAPGAEQDVLLAQLVDRLLDSPRYGERWARHWLDVARFGESNGFEHDELRKNAWPYRDWVIQALNRDMPYDEFARLQIAGDILRPGDADGTIATGFLVAGGYDSVGQTQQSAAMRAVVRQDELEDLVGTIGQTFLGLTVQCARCHDHKFDPVRQTEYYRLSAAVAGVRHGEREIGSAQEKKALEKTLAERRKQIEALQQALEAQEKPIREQILAERRKSGVKQEVVLPPARARWDFAKSLKDEVAGLEVKLHGDALRKNDGLHFPGVDGYASSAPLRQPIQAKTLSALVRLRDLKQRGGAAISLQSLDGQRFDAIVFGEREPGRWMVGSDGFSRSKDLAAPLETEAENKPVHVAAVYQADGTIAFYRNGVPYGKSYKSNGLLNFAGEASMLLFGLRHAPPGGNKHLAGTLLRAELHDRALSAREIAACAGIATDYVAEEEIVRNLEAKAKSERKQWQREVERLQAKAAIPEKKKRVYAVAPRALEPTHLLPRGNPGVKGPPVTPGAVAALGISAEFGLGSDASDAQRRRKLAEWIADANNPLFARVMVNRLWHHHFGIGLVDTPSDFGFNGARPSHPELLDWLAAEFMKPSPEAKGTAWSLKHLHRLIVTSAAYRQDSRYRADAGQRDAANRWLWRKSPMRLEAEAARDTLLAVAGQLNLTAGGPGYQDFKLTIRNATHYYLPLDVDDAALYRRSVYRTWARSGRNGLLDVLDCPDPSTATPRRAMTTTPLQALALMNGAFVLRMADRLAERLRKEAGDDVAGQIVRAYELAYGRQPTPQEMQPARLVVERHGLSILCRAIFNSNEFIYVD